MIFNYKDMAFDRQHGDNFDVMSMSFLDYHQETREITLVWTTVGRKSVWLAQFSGETTEYSGNLSDVLELAHRDYMRARFVPEVKE